jgi:hypothetical protein
MLPPPHYDWHAERSEFLVKCISDAVAREILPLRSLLLCTSHTIESRFLSMEEKLLQIIPTEEAGDIAASKSKDSQLFISREVCAKNSNTQSATKVCNDCIFAYCNISMSPTRNVAISHRTFSFRKDWRKSQQTEHGEQQSKWNKA